MKWTNPIFILVVAGTSLVLTALLFRPAKPNDPTVQQSKPQEIKSEPLKRDASRQPSSSRHIRASDVSWPWPLVARETNVKCSGPPRGPNVVTTEIGGKEFALNGTARAAGFPELGAHWMDDESNPGTKIGLGALTDYALSLCEQNSSNAHVSVSPERLNRDAEIDELKRLVSEQLKDPERPIFEISASALKRTSAAVKSMPRTDLVATRATTISGSS